MKSFRLLISRVLLLAGALGSARAERDGKIQIVLLGDSTTEGSIPRKLVPQGPHLEDVIEQSLAAEGDLPPYPVTNLGLSGEKNRRNLGIE